MQAAIGLAYLKTANHGDSTLAKKIAEKLTDSLPSISKIKDAWQEKIDTMITPLSEWYDQFQSKLASGDGLASMMSAALKSGDGLQALGANNELAAEALMPMWKNLGLDNPEDAKALLDGLQQAGFDSLMKEFMGEFRIPQGEDLIGLYQQGMSDWGIGADPASLKGMQDNWDDWMQMLTQPLR